MLDFESEEVTRVPALSWARFLNMASPRFSSRHRSRKEHRLRVPCRVPARVGSADAAIAQLLELFTHPSVRAKGRALRLVYVDLSPRVRIGMEPSRFGRPRRELCCCCCVVIVIAILRRALPTGRGDAQCARIIVSVAQIAPRQPRPPAAAIVNLAEQ